MSRNLRPVIEKWGTSSSLFLEPEDAILVFNAIVDAVEEARDTTVEAITLQAEDYGDKITVWISHGAAFLDFVESRIFTPKWASRKLLDVRGPGQSQEACKSFVHNLKALAKEWRGFISADSLTFYIDQY